MSTDLPEDVSTDVGGTASPGQQGNFQGGTAELALRMQAAKEQLSNQTLQQQIAQRQAATALTNQKAAGGQGVRLGGGSSSRWLSGNTGQTGQAGAGPRGRGSVAGKPAALTPSTSDAVQNDESTDNPSQVATDFDAQYNQKGLYSKYMANLPNLKPDAQGNLPLTDAKGDTIATIPASDVPMWQQRTNAARLKSGLTPIGPLGTGQNPTSNAPVGTAANPVVAQSTLHVRSLPFGSVIYDPNTQQTYTKQKPPTQ